MVLAVLAALARSAHPLQYDSLRRAEDMIDSRFTWEARAAYYPSGHEGIGLDENGQCFGYTRFTGECQLGLELKWMFSRAIFAMDIQETTLEERELRIYSYGLEEVLRSTSQFSYGSYLEFRVDPANQLDPRIRLAVRTPESAECSFLLSRVLDPVVLAGMAGIRESAEYPNTWLDLLLSAGMVANSQISVGIAGQWTVPLYGAGLPVAAISLRSRYSLGTGQTHALRFRVTLSTQAQSTWIGFSFSLWGSLS